MRTIIANTEHYLGMAFDGLLLSTYTLGLAFAVLVVASEVGVLF